MNKRVLVIILLMPLFVGVMSCENEADPQADKQFFTRFYDDDVFNVAYSPLDVAETSDGGSLVLALKRTIDLEGDDVTPGVIYLMKTDAFGAFVSAKELPETLGRPAPSLLSVGDKFYVFCMDLSNTSVKLIEIGADGSVGQTLDVNATLPLAAGVDLDNNLMLLSFDAGSRLTVMSTVSTAGTIGKSKGFDIGAADGGPYAPEAVIMDHVNMLGKRMPFFVGQTPSPSKLYYFNGIYKYGLAIIFTDLNATNPIGIINGQNDDGGLSSLYALSGGKFAASRFNFGDNYLLPSVSVPTTGTSPTGATGLGGFAMPELTPNAPVVIRPVTINGAEKILFGSNTRGKQIVLYGYLPSDGSLVGTKYLGFSNTFELASMTPTVDQGLLVLGTTYIAGRFPRICLFKLSAEVLGKSFK